MRRREFLATAGALILSSGGSLAQLTPTSIGFLTTRSQQEASSHTAAFLRGLAYEGYVQGQNLSVEYRWASGRQDRLPNLAAELANLRPALLVAGGDPAAAAVKAATASIPVVFIVGDDPVRLGLTFSLNRPGGNATGVSLVTSALGAKRLALLSEALPEAVDVALLVNPNNPNSESHTQEVRVAAQQLNRNHLVVSGPASDDFSSVYQLLDKQKIRALVVQNDPFFDSQRTEIIRLSADHKVATIYHIREFPIAGGLMSYGPDLVDGYYQLGIQAGRVLKGGDPRGMP